MTTAWIALGVSAAAFLWTVIWSVWLYRRTSRPRLTVTARATNLYDIPALLVEAANTGPVPVTVNSVKLTVQGKEGAPSATWLAQRPGMLPLELEPGSGHWTGWADRTFLHEELDATLGKRGVWQVKADVGITGGRRFLSEWTSI